MRAMLDAKIQGRAMQPGAASAPLESNVIDLMAALKRSLGGPIPASQFEEAPAWGKVTKRAEAKEGQLESSLA